MFYRVHTHLPNSGDELAADDATKGRKRASPKLALGEPLSWAATLCVANAVVGKGADEVSSAGFWAAAFDTFGISIIVWTALYVGMKLLFQSDRRDWNYIDVIIASIAVAASMIPWGVPAWGALSLIGLRLILATSLPDTTKAAGLVLFAAAVPLVWSKIVFALFSEYILSFDASIVAVVLGTHRDGNIVEIAAGVNNAGSFDKLRIAAACSSFANISLVVPLWTVLRTVRKAPFRAQDVGWPVAAAVSIVVINVTRISLIGFFPDHYGLIHGEVGQSVVNMIILITSVSICAKGASYGMGCTTRS